MPGYYSSMQDPGQTNTVVAHKRSSQLSVTEPQSSTQPPKKKSKRSSSTSPLLEPETSTTQQEPSEKNKQDYDKWTLTDHLMFLWGLEECTGKHRWKAISEQFLPHKPARKITSHNQKFELRLTVSQEKREKTPSMLDVRAIDPSYRDYLHAVRRATLERNSELLHQPADTRTLSSNLLQQPAINYNHTNDNSALCIQYYGDQVPTPTTDSSSPEQQESAYQQQEPHHQAIFETLQRCADLLDLDDDQQDVPMQQLDTVYAELSSLLMNSGEVGNATNAVTTRNGGGRI